MPPVLLKPHEIQIDVCAGVTCAADGGQSDRVTHAANSYMNKTKRIYRIYPLFIPGSVQFTAFCIRAETCILFTLL